MFGIGDKGCADTQNELRVNLDVCVTQDITGLLLLASEFVQFLLVIVEWYLELLLSLEPFGMIISADNFAWEIPSSPIFNHWTVAGLRGRPCLGLR